MRNLRSVLLALPLSVLVLAGCIDADWEESPRGTRAEPTATGPAVQDEFRTALRRLQAAPYRFTADSELTVATRITATGVHDPKAHRIARTYRVTGDDPLQAIVIGDDSYSRINDSEPWQHSSVGTFATVTGFDQKDPTGLARFAENVTSVERTGAHAYRGSFVLPKRSRYLPLGIPALEMTARSAGDFIAATDQQGNIASIGTVVRTPDLTFVMTTKFSDHGKTVTIARPKNITG